MRILSFLIIAIILPVSGCDTQTTDRSGSSPIVTGGRKYYGAWVRDETRLKIYGQGKADMLEVWYRGAQGEEKTTKMVLNEDAGGVLYFHKGNGGRVDILYDEQQDVLAVSGLGDFKREEEP